MSCKNIHQSELMYSSFSQSYSKSVDYVDVCWNVFRTDSVTLTPGLTSSSSASLPPAFGAGHFQNRSPVVAIFGVGHFKNHSLVISQIVFCRWRTWRAVTQNHPWDHVWEVSLTCSFFIQLQLFICHWPVLCICNRRCTCVCVFYLICGCLWWIRPT